MRGKQNQINNLNYRKGSEKVPAGFPVQRTNDKKLKL